MAKRDNDIKNKINVGIYGTGTDLDKMSNNVSDIVKQTALEVATKFGKRVDNKVIDNYTNLNLSNLFSPQTGGSRKAVENKINSVEQFKTMMQDNTTSAVQLMTAEQGRIINYSNYKAIVDNIPEMALAKDTYLANILSPDDYTKTIFNITYKSSNKTDEEIVKGNIKKIIQKYNIEDLIEKIIDNTLTYGDCFVSVLPYDREIGKFLAQTSAKQMLNEGLESPLYQKLDEQMHLTERMYSEVLTEDMVSEVISVEEQQALNEAFGTNINVNQFVTDVVNDKIKINSVTELLRNRAEAENDILFSKHDIETKKNKKSNKKNIGEDLQINGADVKILDADKMVALEVDGINYGYYYIEPGFQGAKDQPYNANNPKAYAAASNPLNPTIQPQLQTAPGESAANPVAQNLNISDEKLGLISNVLLKALSKKLNKKYINDNKQFKDLLFNLLKQKYLFEKGVSITYFLPEEIVHFKADSIFSKIVFYAKLYIALLTNTVIIKLGRAHDKRIYYIQTGVDNNHEQAIMKVVQDVKTKEFKMSNLGSVASILQLNPGQFDDYYMPVVNGERPVDIETIQGMDQDINNDFMEFLRRSMVLGTDLPTAFLEAKDNIEFARQIAAQNANFCRQIIRWQKKLTKPSEQLIKLIYLYENKYTLDKDNASDNININDITITYPSPASLNLTNLIETLTQVDSLAEYVTKVYVPDKMDQSNTDIQSAFKQTVIKKMITQIDWADMDQCFENFKDTYSKDALINISNAPEEDQGNSDYNY